MRLDASGVTESNGGHGVVADADDDATGGPAEPAVARSSAEALLQMFNVEVDQQADAFPGQPQHVSSCAS
jgi:hypothetical protein